ncbi:MAG: hypothetical protein EOP04_03150 [Proteobacteria bacterium]|nr:MAG: hypothetical protein EOP04_03150 [Pseudomonadota bacterium]
MSQAATLRKMIEQYFVEHIDTWSSSATILDSKLSGPFALLAFYKAMMGETEPTLDDLSENLVGSFAAILKREVTDEQFLLLTWDLIDWFSWLHENSYTWVNLGKQIMLGNQNTTRLVS